MRASLLRSIEVSSEEGVLPGLLISILGEACRVPSSPFVRFFIVKVLSLTLMIWPRIAAVCDEYRLS